MSVSNSKLWALSSSILILPSSRSKVKGQRITQGLSEQINVKDMGSNNYIVGLKNFKLWKIVINKDNSSEND